MASRSQIFPGGRKRRRGPSTTMARKRARTGPAVSTGSITRRYLQGSTKVRKVLRYYDTFQLDPAVGGTPATYIFLANGCFDPDTTIGGHQPRGFDQYMAMYDHFTVVKATAKVYFDSNAEASGMLGVVSVRDGKTPITTQIGQMEYGMKSVALLNSAGSSVNVSFLRSATISVDIAKFLGVKDVISGREFAGSAAADPEEEVTFQIAAFPINTGDAQPVNCAIEIEYDVLFHEPKNPTSS